MLFAAAIGLVGLSVSITNCHNQSKLEQEEKNKIKQFDLYHTFGSGSKNLNGEWRSYPWTKIVKVITVEEDKVRVYGVSVDAYGVTVSGSDTYKIEEFKSRFVKFEEPVEY